MIRCDFIPYEGEENYIFVSYAHRDADVVFPIIEQLNDMGYRIWYDDGIAPGSEWPEDIANHLNGCALMMAFITPNSLASDNCRREITYALAKKKAFLGVILEPVEMSPGIEMQLSAQQCVVRYSYRNDEAFLRKLCSSQEMAACRALTEKTEPVAEPASLVEQKPVPEKVKTPKVAPVAPQKREKTKIANGKTLFIAGGAVLAALAVVLVLMFVLPAMGEQKEPTESQWIQILEENVYIHETSLYLSGENISADTVEKICRLTSLEYLNFNRCSFETGVLAGLTLPETIRSVTLADCTGVDDLQFLAGVDKLSTLILTNSGITDELLPAFSFEEIYTLELSGNEAITDLTRLSGVQSISTLNLSGTGITTLEALAGHSVEELNFSDTAVADLAPLADMESLRNVIGANSKVRDLSPLKKLEDLRVLNFSGCSLDTPEGEFLALRLEELHLANTGIAGLDAFKNMTVLRVLDISGNGLVDISPLAKSGATLKTVNFSGNDLDGEDIAFLTDADLIEVNLNGVQIADLDMLKNSPDLIRLSAVGCGIQDISALTGFEKMSLIRLAKNEITDISPLKDLSNLYLTMDLSFNPIRDISSLPKQNYTLLGLLCEDLDPATFPDVDGNQMLLYYSESAVEEIVAQKNFCYIVLNCPLDKKVALEDTVGSYLLKFPNSLDALVELMLEEYDMNVSYLLEEMP